MTVSPISPRKLVFSICASASLRKASRLVTQQFDAALRPAGLRVTQFTILSVLMKAAQIRQSDLAKVLGMDGTTLTRNLQVMQKKTWIRIDRDDDQRVRLISLTLAGQQTHAAAEPFWIQAQTRFVENLGRSQWAALQMVLEPAICTAEQMQAG